MAEPLTAVELAAIKQEVESEHQAGMIGALRWYGAIARLLDTVQDRDAKLTAMNHAVEILDDERRDALAKVEAYREALRQCVEHMDVLLDRAMLRGATEAMERACELLGEGTT